MITVACYQCGHQEKITAGHNVSCPRCLGQGHIYRLMTKSELIVSAERNEREGFTEVAAHRRAIAEKL